MARFINRRLLFSCLLVIVMLFPMWRAMADAAVEGTLKWVYNTGGETSAPAVGRDGTIYVASGDLVYAISADGSLKWTVTVQEAGPPAVGDDGTIYVTSEQYVYAISPAGTIMWSFFTRETSPGLGLPAIGRDGTIYVFSNYHESDSTLPQLLYAINPTGTKKWIARQDQYVEGYGCDDGGCWSPGPASSLAIGQDGTIYVISLSDVISFRSDGTANGVFHDQPGGGNIAIDKDGAIYVLREWGFDVMNWDGTMNWENWAGDYYPYSISVGSDGSVFNNTTCEGHNFLDQIIDKNIGWWFDTQENDFFLHPVSIGDGGTVYATIGSGLYAIDQNGDEKWFFPINGPSSTAISEDGTLYVGSADGLHAIHSSSKGPANSGWPMDRHDAQRTCRSDKSDPFTARTEDFNSGTGLFAYKDDTFYSTNRPPYADGNYVPTGGYGGSGGLHVLLGNVDNRNILNGMSGGWKATFPIDEGMNGQFELRYRLVMNGYDTDECAKVLVSIDGGTPIVLESLCGRNKDTGWKQKSFSHFLSAGSHTIIIGGYNNKKTYIQEYADIYIDDVEVR